jgi:hypothetical protein
MQEITSRSFLVSAKGGTVDYVAPDGEFLFSVAVPAGRISAREYLDLLPDGCSIEVADGLAVVNPRSGYGVQAYGPGSHDTGANPDFQPTSASRMEMEMRLTLNRMQAQTARLEARERALASIERIPTPPAPAAPVVEDAPVVE